MLGMVLTYYIRFTFLVVCSVLPSVEPGSWVPVKPKPTEIVPTDTIKAANFTISDAQHQVHFAHRGSYWQVSEMAHMRVSLDLKNPLQKVKRTCRLIESIREDKLEDENAQAFVGKLMSQQDTCDTYLSGAMSLLKSIGVTHMHGDGHSPFQAIDVGELPDIPSNSWSTTKIPLVVGRTTPSPITTTTLLNPWNRVAGGTKWGEMPELFTIPPFEEPVWTPAPMMESVRGVKGRTADGEVCGFELLEQRALSNTFLLTHCSIIEIPEIIPNSTKYNPEGLIAGAFYEYQSTGNLGILREAYRTQKRKMQVSYNFGGLGKYVEDAVGKVKRQAGIIATLIGGMALGSEWDWIKKELGLGGDTESTAISHVVNEDTKYIQILNRHVGSLEQTAVDIRKDIQDFEHYKSLEDEYDKIVALRQQVIAIYDRFQRGIQQVIQTERPNTNLISSEQMYQELALLTTKLRSQHKDILITDRSQTWEMDTSYFLFSNFTLILFVHFPVGNSMNKMQLLEYLPTPIRLGNDTQFYTVHSEKTLMAVAETRKHTYKEMSWGDLGKCTRTGKDYFCPKRTTHEYDHEASCLSSLYWSQTDVAYLTCPLRPVPHEDLVTQLNPSVFVLAIEGVERFQFSCGPEDLGELKMSGILRVSIPRGCKVEGMITTLVPTYELHWNIGNVSVVPLDMARDVNESVSSFASSSGVYQIHSGSPGPSLHELDSHWTQATLSEERHLSLKDKLFNLLYGVIMMFVLIVVLKIGWACWERRTLNQRINRLNTEADIRFRQVDELGRHHVEMSNLLRQEMNNEAVSYDHQGEGEMENDRLSQAMSVEPEPASRGNFPPAPTVRSSRGHSRSPSIFLATKEEIEKLQAVTSE